jgi:hypothetical protein
MPHSGKYTGTENEPACRNGALLQVIEITHRLQKDAAPVRARKKTLFKINIYVLITYYERRNFKT